MGHRSTTSSAQRPAGTMPEPRHSFTVEVRPFDRSLVKKAASFSCGQPDLDEWLRHHAGQQERRNNTRTFLGVLPGSDQVIGYYATTTYRIEPDDTSVEYGAGHHRYPIPAVLLARLAVDHHWRGGRDRPAAPGRCPRADRGGESVGGVRVGGCGCDR